MALIDEHRIAGALREALIDELGPQGEFSCDPQLAEAELVLVPGRDTVQPRELPLNSVLHKVVMVRDRLRMIEQVINASSTLTDLERIGLQLRVTRVQEALVAFSALLLR